MSSNTNKDVVRRFYEDVISQGKVHLLPELPPSL